MVRNSHDAEDAIQEVMIRVLKGLGRFNGQYKLEAWVARVAQNHCLDVIRSAARRPEYVESPLINDNDEQSEPEVRAISLDDPEEIVERKQEQEAVSSTLSELPRHHRAALVMREFNGASHEEIAEALGLTAPRAKALIHRAKRSFREAWETKPWAMRALLPVFFFRKIADLFRRVPAEGADVAAAAPMASITPIVVASAPAAQQAVSIVSEKVVASVTAVVVAASTLGAGVAVNQSRPEPRPRTQSLAAEPTPTLTVVSASPSVAGSVASVPQYSMLPSPEVSTPAVSAAPSPSASSSTDPSPNASASASPSATADPQPSPDPSPSPDPANAPPYNAAFSVWATSEDSCDCNSKTTVDRSRTNGEAGKDVRFLQEVRGPAFDGENDAAWRYWLWFDGYAEKSSGAMDFTFELQSGRDAYQYKGYAELVKMQVEGGDPTYVFSGSYSLADGDPETAPVADGTFTMTQTWWLSTDVLYDVSVEVSPS